LICETGAAVVWNGRQEEARLSAALFEDSG
jgi:hypothetical protein